MLIEKIINNNIVSAYDETGTEIVVMGRGIGFGMKTGTPVDEQRIEKTFRIQNRNVADRFKELLTHMPMEHVSISNDVISYAHEHLNQQLNQSIYLSLTDHINFTIRRYHDGIIPENALLWDIKRFYREEYELGQYAVRLIRERLGIDLPDDEAGFIALHFLNAEYGTNLRDVMNAPQLLQDILDIIPRELHFTPNDQTLHYERFVIHTKFLIQRICRREVLTDDAPEMVALMRTRYPKEYRCGEKIAEYIQEAANTTISDEEIMYLAMHIRRIIMEENQEE